MNTTLTIRGTTVLRIGISLVFVWFGTQQLLSADMWIGFIPEWVIKLSPVSATTLVHFNGALEVVFGTALMLGFFTRISALILALHMSHITFLVGYDSIGVRDFAISVAAFSIFFNGADPFSLDHLFFFHSQKGETPTPPRAEPLKPLYPPYRQGNGTNLPQ